MFKSIEYQERNQALNLIGGYAYKAQIIGKGAFAKVYEGVDQQTGETVALKFIKGQDLKLANRLGLISNEVKTLKRLKGKQNVLEWYSCVHHFDQICIVTEFCSKGTLKNKLRTQTLTFSQKMDLIFQINRGFQSFCKEKIIHRDLKPSNIFLTRNGVVKIGDFGFSVLLDDLNVHNKSRVGSAHYMAPQVLNKFQYSPKSDIWSLGIVFYQILTGKKPWGLKSSRKIYDNIKQNPINQLVKDCIQISPKIRNLLEKMLAFKAQDRISPQQLNIKISNMHIEGEEQSFQKKKQKIQTKNLIKKLVNIIDFCRINYYVRYIILQHIKKFSSCNFTSYFKTANGRKMISYLSETIQTELNKVQQLSYLSDVQKEYLYESKEYARILSIVKAYRDKYLSSKITSKLNNENVLENTLLWFDEHLFAHSPFMMLIIFDYLLTIRSISKQLQSYGIDYLIKKCSMAEISGKLKSECMEQKSQKLISIEDLKRIKKIFKLSQKK